MQFAHELIVPEVGFSFKLFLFEGREGHYHREKHWHRSIEIFAVCDGELEFKIDEKTWHLTAGEFMIVNSNEVHEVDSPLPNETIVLQIPLKVFENIIQESNLSGLRMNRDVRTRVLWNCWKNCIRRIVKSSVDMT